MKYLCNSNKILFELERVNCIVLNHYLPSDTWSKKAIKYNHFSSSFCRWAILFSHPADYTPVCTTELSQAQKLAPEFEKRGVKMAALSCDDADSHKGWINDIKFYTDGKFSYPIIADPKRELAVKLGMVDPDEKDAAGLPLTCRAVSTFKYWCCTFLEIGLLHLFSLTDLYAQIRVRDGKMQLHLRYTRMHFDISFKIL